MEACAIQPVIGKMAIDGLEPERKRRPARYLGSRNLRAKHGQLFGAKPIGKGKFCGHRSTTSTHVFLFCSTESLRSQAA